MSQHWTHLGVCRFWALSARSTLFVALGELVGFFGSRGGD